MSHPKLCRLHLVHSSILIHLGRLEVKQNNALRNATGCNQKAAVSNLTGETGVLTLRVTIKGLLDYAIKIAATWVACKKLHARIARPFTLRIQHRAIFKTAFRLLCIVFQVVIVCLKSDTAYPLNFIKTTYIHDQLKLRPCFLPWVSKNRRYRILKGIDGLCDFFILLNLEAWNLVRRISNWK